MADRQIILGESSRKLIQAGLSTAAPGNSRPSGFSSKTLPNGTASSAPSHVHNLRTNAGLGSVVRNSVANYMLPGRAVGATALVFGSAAVNVARFDADGLIIEPRTTNLVTTPDRMVAAPWTNIGGVVPYASAFADPIGVAGSTEINTSGANDRGVEQTVTVVNNGRYTASVWLADSFGFAEGVFAPTIENNGATTLLANPRGSGRFASHLRTDWARHSASILTVGTSAVIAPVNKRAATGIADETVLPLQRMWGAQVERRAFATSFVSGSRALEQLEFGGGNFDDPSLYNSGGGIYLQAVAMASNVAQTLGAFSGCSLLNWGSLGSTADWNRQLLCTDAVGEWCFKDSAAGGLVKFSPTPGAGHVAAGQQFRAYVTWNALTIALFINGAKIGEVARPGVWTAGGILRYGGDVGAVSGFQEPFAATLQGIAQFRSRLSDDACIAITNLGVSGIAL